MNLWICVCVCVCFVIIKLKSECPKQDYRYSSRFILMMILWIYAILCMYKYLFVLFFHFITIKMLEYVANGLFWKWTVCFCVCLFLKNKDERISSEGACYWLSCTRLAYTIWRSLSPWKLLPKKENCNKIDVYIYIRGMMMWCAMH